MKSLFKQTGCVSLIIIGHLFFSCNINKDNKYEEITEFPITKSIVVNSVLTDSVILAPDELFIVDDYLILYQKKKEKLFDVFNLSDLQYLYSCGTKGQGPEEFVYPIGQTIQSQDSCFTILDANVLKTVKLNANKGLQIITTEKTFNSFPINGFVRLQDFLFCSFADCATKSTGDLEYQLINTVNDSLLKFSKYPKLSIKEYEGEQRCQYYYKYLVANSERQKIVAFYSFFKFIRFFTFDGSLEKEIFVKIYPFDNDNIENWEERKIYYAKPVATQQYIFAPCSASEIQVWDWNGKPIARYIIDKEFYSFTVSEKYKRIILVTTNELDIDKFYYFDISDLKYLP